VRSNSHPSDVKLWSEFLVGNIPDDLRPCIALGIESVIHDELSVQDLVIAQVKCAEAVGYPAQTSPAGCGSVG
jgi:hypothetical protein